MATQTETPTRNTDDAGLHNLKFRYTPVEVLYNEAQERLDLQSLPVRNARPGMDLLMQDSTLEGHNLLVNTGSEHLKGSIRYENIKHVKKAHLNGEEIFLREITEALGADALISMGLGVEEKDRHFVPYSTREN